MNTLPMTPHEKEWLDKLCRDYVRMKTANAALESYTKHFADPLAAAEADLLGEALIMLKEIGNSRLCPAECSCKGCVRLRALLAKVKEAE